MIREAWVSILGLYNHDNTVLDGLKVPEGLDRDTVINNILMECAELEILFPDADFMKEAVRQWSAMCLPVWQHLYDTTQYEYNPIWNKDGEIIGNIMYTKAWLDDEKGERKEILSFGPLCVAPKYQRQKLGKVLIEHSFEVARKMGYDVNINFGNPGNYVSRGFVSCKKKNVSFVVPGNFPTALLVAELIPGALESKNWMYIPSSAADCCEDTAAVEAFDATFPPKEKKWMPSQEEFYIYSHSSVVR